MLLRRHNTLMGSTVFLRTVLSGLIGVIGLIGLLWVGFGIHRTQTLAEVRASLDGEMEALESLHTDQGVGGLVASLRYDGQAIWDPDWLYAILEEDEFIIRVLTEDDETLAGFHGIDPPGGGSRAPLSTTRSFRAIPCSLFACPWRGTKRK